MGLPHSMFGQLRPQGWTSDACARISLRITIDERRHLVVEQAAERDLFLTMPTSEAQGLALAEAVDVGNLRIEGVELLLGDLGHGVRSIAIHVETCATSASSVTIEVHAPRHSANRDFSVPSIESHRRSIGGKTCKLR